MFLKQDLKYFQKQRFTDTGWAVDHYRRIAGSPVMVDKPVYKMFQPWRDD